MGKLHVCPNCIIFIEQMQQNKYIKYVALLQNLQNGKITYLNFNLLTTCFLTTINVNLFYDPWKTTLIVLRNELLNTINNQMIHIHSI